MVISFCQALSFDLVSTVHASDLSAFEEALENYNAAYGALQSFIQARYKDRQAVRDFLAREFYGHTVLVTFLKGLYAHPSGSR